MLSTSVKRLFNVVICLVLVLTSCSPAEHKSEQEMFLNEVINAVDQNNKVEHGEINTEIDLTVDFESDKLTSEEQVKNEVFKHMILTSTYRSDSTNSENKLTLLFGATALQIMIFKMQGKTFIKIPIYNQYLDLNDTNIYTQFIHNKISQNEFAEFIRFIADGHLNEKLFLDTSVFNNSQITRTKENIMTKSGNIKVLCYKQTLDRLQLQDLLEAFCNNNKFLQNFYVKNMDVSDWELNTEVSTWLSQQGKLVRQDIIIIGKKQNNDISTISVIDNELMIDILPITYFEMKISIDYMNNGIEQIVTVPSLTEENTLNAEEAKKILKDLFNGL